MRNIILFILLSISPFVLFAHGGDDPIKNLKKNRSRLSEAQTSFIELTSREDRLESLENQANYLQRNVLILRNLMAKDYPHVNTNMSKYKLDYIEEIEDSLKEFKQTIKLMKMAIPD